MMGIKEALLQWYTNLMIKISAICNGAEIHFNIVSENQYLAEELY